MKENKLSLTKRLQMLREGLLNTAEMMKTIADLGHSELASRNDVRDDLVNLVSHPDCYIRSEAMMAVAYHGLAFSWDEDPGKRLLDILTEMALGDPDPDCRRGAVNALGSLFRDSSRLDVMQTLASVCGKSGEEGDVRACAYTGFLDVIGIPLNDQPNPFDLEVGEEELARVAAYLGKSK